MPKVVFRKDLQNKYMTKLFMEGIKVFFKNK